MPNSSSQILLPKRYRFKRWQVFSLIVLGAILFALTLLVILRFTYRARFLPGVKVYGLYVGGLNREEAKVLLEKETNRYIESSTIIINADGSSETATIPAGEVELTYNIDNDLEAAYNLGREGQLINQLLDQTALIFNIKSSEQANVTYNPAKLYAIIQPISKTLTKPVKNASYTLSSDDELTIIKENTGRRMNLHQFVRDYEDIIKSLKRSAVTIKASSQKAAVTSDSLETKRNNLMPFVTSPLTLTFEKNRWEVPTAELLSWLSYANNVMPVRDNIVENYYQIKPANLTYVDLDIGRIKSHLGSISKNINQPAKDALLTVEGERATVFQQSQDGRAVDLDMTAKTIAENVMSTTPAPDVPLTVVVTKADVTNDTIDQLGIKELLSEGVSYFPGSSANRITNIRVGSKRYNGVLLEPGEVFSFGEILGKVGPEQGYKEGRVILEGRTESQYGGGLCQVSSTAFRAALLAGLPILERYNHSFAVSYYTQPYGVPGVDATIYYPSVDFKFKNDTANHILIQTELVGTTLKFRFYGTKEKTGVIRGPNFIYGSNDPNQPSKTVFYRDIVVGGEVVKTNTIYTTYRSALDFPPVD
jgi:vancomycin resistance protein YoaR